MRTRALTSLIAGAAFCFAAAATQAAPIVFDLTRDVSGDDNVSTVSLLGGSSLSVDITPNPDFRTIDWDDQGMGVQGLLEFNDELDGFGFDESLIFTFSETVRLVSATFSRVGSNDDFRVITGGGITVDGDPNIQNPFDFLNYTLIDSVFEFTVTERNDDYKIAEIVVATIPEPNVLALLALGLIGSLVGRLRRP